MRSLNLQDIFHKPKLTRLESSRGISQIEDKFIRHTLSDDPLFKKLASEFGEEAIKDFIKMVQLIKSEDVEPGEVFWCYALNSNMLRKRKSIRRDGVSDVYNPQQNQFASIKKGRGNVLILGKRSYSIIMERHQVRQLNKKIATFSQLPIFSDLPHALLTTVCEKVSEIKYQKNNVVYSQDKVASKLYIVKEGTFVMNRYNQNHKRCKSVLLLDNFNIFGEECLQFSLYSQSVAKYLSQVSCKSNEGVLFVIDKSVLFKVSKSEDLNLSTSIFQMYKQRRRIAMGKQFDDEMGEAVEMESGDRLKKYYERLHKLRRRNPTKFNPDKEDMYTDIQFFRKDEFISMKLKLKYQSILDKVKTMNSVTLKKIEINTKNQPKSFTKGVVDIQKKFILKSLQKKYQDRSLRNHSKMVMNALKIQASEDDEFPKHKSEYLRTKPNRSNLYNSQGSRDISKNSPTTELSEDVGKNRSDINIFNFTNRKERSHEKERSLSIKT